MKKLILALLLTPTPSLAWDLSVTGQQPCDQFLGTATLDGDRLTATLRHPQSDAFWFDTRVVNGTFDTRSHGTRAGVRIQGTLNPPQGTISVYASESNCDGILVFK